MNVVQINAVYQYSSTGRTTKEMHQYLMSHGHNSYVFCTNYISEENHIFPIGGKIDHKIHALLSRISGLQGYYSRFATQKLIQRLERIAPEIVILRNLHGNYIHVPLLLRYLARHDIPTVVVLHDCWFFTGHCCHYTMDQCLKWKTACHHCPSMGRYNKSLFFDTSTKCFFEKLNLFRAIPRLAVVGVSDWITNEARQSPIFTNAKVFQRIYNWIDLDIFQPRNATSMRQQIGLSKSDFVVLGVSQEWSEYKGLLHFIELGYQCPDIMFVMVGEMSDSTKEKLPSNVHAVGSVSDVNTLAEYYSMANVFLNFSIQETFGKVSAEALACGTPLITNDSTANPELCGDGCGYIFHYDAWEEVPKLIYKIKSENKNNYTRQCQNFAQNCFKMNNGLKQYMQLFDQLISYGK